MRCPFCGEKANDGDQTRNGTLYECGTFVWDDEIDRSNQTAKCINAEVGALKARIARLENAGDALARQTLANGRSHLQWFASREAKP